MKKKDKKYINHRKKEIDRDFNKIHTNKSKKKQKVWDKLMYEIIWIK